MRPQHVMRRASVAVLAFACAGFAPAIGAEADTSPQVIVTASTFAHNQTSTSFVFTVSSSHGSLLLVQVAIHGAGTASTPAPSVASVSYAGSQLTAVLGEPSTGTLSPLRDEVWYLANPPSGSAQLTVTLSSAANVYVMASEIDGVKKSRALRASSWNEGTGTAAQVTVPAREGTLAIDALAVAADGVDWNTVTPAPTQTLLLADLSGSAADDVIAGSSDELATEEVPKPGTAMDWSWNSSSAWVQIAVELAG